MWKNQTKKQFDIARKRTNLSINLLLTKHFLLRISDDDNNITVSEELQSVAAATRPQSDSGLCPSQRAAADLARNIKKKKNYQKGQIKCTTEWCDQAKQLTKTNFKKAPECTDESWEK